MAFQSAVAFCAATIILALADVGAGKKIVWVPFPGAVSHHMLAAKVGRELASRGHEFVVVNADYDGKQFKHVNTTGITEILYQHPRTPEDMHSWLEEIADLDPFAGTAKMVEMIYDGCDNLLRSPHVLEKISDADVMIVDASTMCGSVVRDHLKTPIRVDFLPVTFMDPFYGPRLGSSNLLSSTPQMGSRLQPNMDFSQRLHNTIVGLVDLAVEYFVTDPAANKLRAKYGLHGSHKDAMADVGIFISQSTWVTEFPRAVAPAIKLVGPILPEPAEPVANGLNDFLRTATKSGVLVSFGSQARIDQEFVNKMAIAFNKLKEYKFIWKSPGYTPAKKSSNVMIMDWLPQNDLLGNDYIKCFISHGGLNGVSEAAYHGVPVIGFPLFSDQWDNIALLEYQGMAVSLDSNNFTSASLAKAIKHVANTPEYAQKAAAVSKIVKDSPHGDKQPTELAADWVEYAIRHDGAMFHKVPGLKMHWLARDGYDMLSIGLALILFAIIGLDYSIKKCFPKKRVTAVSIFNSIKRKDDTKQE
jgi:UDP:flavonoid glycosyltransferase YjiC (YdhE family)